MKTNMKAFAVLIGIALTAWAQVDDQQPKPEPQPPQIVKQSPRFEAVDVFIDSNKAALAAYQFELNTEQGQVEIVGIEGGEHTAFAEPPFYDPKAMKQNRVILAAFNTGDELPVGKTRIARVHVMVSGQIEPAYSARLTVSASAEGDAIPANISVVKGVKS